MFSQQLQASMDRRADPRFLTSVLSALNHLGPFRLVNYKGPSFPWIAGILDSRDPERISYQMAGRVVQLLGKHFDYDDSWTFHPGWISPLLSFLSLGEKFYSTESPPYTGFTAFRILVRSRGDADFGPTLLPVLASALLPANPLQARSFALRVFHIFIAGWFSPQMENVLKKDIDRLLQAVGDRSGSQIVLYRTGKLLRRPNTSP